jgi:acetolactate synthase-1/2/3 large subunit
MLVQAENPLILTNYAGRHPQSVASLVELAETLNARVVASPARLNFPVAHPLFGGYEVGGFLAEADVILIIDHDVPYVPVQTKPRPEARIIHLDIDPLKAAMPVWGFPADILVQADSRRAIPELVQAIRSKITSDRQTVIQSRLPQIQSQHQQMLSKWQAMASIQSSRRPISPDWLFHCVNEVIDENTLVLEEVVTNRAALLRQIRRTQPGTFFQSGGSNLGWGLGAAIGARLAAPDKTVVSLVGDGSFIFGCPTAALWAANRYQAPFLCVIANNSQYTAPRIILRQALGSDSFSEKSGNWVGTDLKPSPDFAALARSCWAYGETVDNPSDLKPALIEALKQVQAGKTAVLDVKVEAR